MFSFFDRKDFANNVHRMPCTRHGGDGAPPRRGVQCGVREGPEALAPSERQGGAPRLLLGRDRDGDILLIHAREAEIRIDPAAAIAPSRQRPGSHLGESAIVDIAEFGHPTHQLIDRRRTLAGPAPFPQLAHEIARQLLPRRRVSFDVAEGEPPQRLALERWNIAI